MIYTLIVALTVRNKVLLISPNKQIRKVFRPKVLRFKKIRVGFKIQVDAILDFDYIILNPKEARTQ